MSTQPITEALCDAILRVNPGPQRTNARQLADVLMRKAFRGDIEAAKFIWERLQGGKPFPLKASGKPGEARSKKETIARIKEALTSSAERSAAGLRLVPAVAARHADAKPRELPPDGRPTTGWGATGPWAPKVS